MATKYIGKAVADSGELPAVTVSSSTTSAPIELAIDDTAVDAQQVLLALEAFRKEVMDNGVTAP